MKAVNTYGMTYEEAKQEFNNCLLMGPITLFVSWVLAFTEWKPIMNALKK